MKTPFTDAFLEQLKVKMQKLKIKQTTLARDIGTSKCTVYNWFHNLRKPNGEFILKIQAFMKDKITMFL